MWRTQRRRQAAAADAIAHLVHDGVTEIRTMAYRREPLRDELFPGTDYQEQIRLISDALDTLVPGLRRRRRYPPTYALQATWDSRDDQQRQWIRHTLATHHLDIEKLITTTPPDTPA
ncbi:MAG: hypothetical protein ACRDT6_10870 [Micromonosporaceae bacterium]